MSTMYELKIKEALERALHTRVTQAEWRHLKRAWSGGGSLSSDRLAHDAAENWQEFQNFAAEHLWLLRSYEEDKVREQHGELEPNTETEEIEASLDQGDVSSSLSNRTFVRAQALGSLNLLRTGGRSSGGATIHGTLFPRGGLDDTLAQWVYVVAAELWVPTEEVANAYRRLQKSMLANPNPPKTSTRAFEVAAFVWDNERVHGTRPPWPELCERWNKWPLTEPFDDWRHFRTTFLRGAKATAPRYKASNEQITNQVRSGGQKILDVWTAKVRE